LRAGSRMSGVKEGAAALVAGDGGGGGRCGGRLVDAEVEDSGRIGREGCWKPDMAKYVRCFG
jgi:hypothetical protein